MAEPSFLGPFRRDAFGTKNENANSVLYTTSIKTIVYEDRTQQLRINYCETVLLWHNTHNNNAWVNLDFRFI